MNISNNQKQEDSKLLHGIGTAGALAGAAAVAIPIFKKKPGLIQKVFNKELTPRYIVHSDPKMWHKFEQLGHAPFKPMSGGFYGGTTKGLKRGEIGLLQGFEYIHGRKTPKPMINQPGQQWIKNLTDKYLLGKKLQVTDSGAKTWKLTPANIEQLKKMKSRKEVIDYFNKIHGTGKWVYKPRADILDELGIKTSAGRSGIITSGSKSNSLIESMRKYPKQFIGQNKLNIQNEYRVRILNNKVISVIPRYPTFMGRVLQGATPGHGIGGGPAFLTPSHKQDIQKLIDQNKNILSSKKGITTFGLDVASVRNPGNKLSYKIIEVNPVSGAELNNPVVTSKLYKELTGKTSTWEKGVRGLGAAGLIGTAAVAAKPLYSDKQNKKSTWQIS